MTDEESIKRDIVLRVAEKVFVQGVNSLRCLEHPTMKEIIEVTKTLTEISLIVGEIYADAQIEYCKEKENDRND